MGDTAPDAEGGSASRLVGAIQLIGGGLEIALGVGAVGAPTGVTQVGGVILIAHGADTMVAGFRSLWNGQVSHTYTQQGGAAAARWAGASDQTAQYVGAGADFIAGVGPGVAIGVSRRLAIAGAEGASERVAVAYMHRSALEMGHNAVGIRQGGTTAWFHFAGTPTGAFEAMARAPGAKYVITELTVTAEEAARADAARRILVQSGEQAWGYLGPNCTTTSLKILQQAGIVVPAWSRTPILLHLGLRAGSEITVVGGGAAAGFGVPFLAVPGGGAPGAAGPNGSAAADSTRPLSPNAQRLLDALPTKGALTRAQVTGKTGLVGPPLYEAIQELERRGKITVTRFGMDELNIREISRR